MGDYHLQDTSPAVDAGVGVVGGVNAPAIDYDGGKRPTFGGFDIGADELPGAPVLDTFNRTNTSSGLGSANWGGQTALLNFRINNNQLQLNSFTQSSIFWNASKFAANQEAYVTIVGNANNFTGAGLVLKIDGLQANGMAGANTHAIIVTYLGNRQVQVQTLSPNLVFTNRATFTMPVGTSLSNAELRAQSLSDGTVKVYWNGSLVGSVNVTSGQGGWNPAFASAPGYIGVVATTNGTRLDNFGGGITR
jgi:hypothetical protein